MKANNSKTKAQPLEESEQKYYDMVESSPYGIITVDLKGIVTFCNNTFLKLTGFSRDDIINKHFTKLPTLQLSDIPIYVKLFNSILRGNTPELLEYRWIHKNGSSHFAESHISRIKRKRKIIGFQAILIDLTERKREQEERRKLQEAISIAKEAISIKSSDLLITYANDALYNLFGYEKGELIGKHVSILNAEGTIDATVRMILESLEKNSYWEGEVHNKRKNGEEFMTYATITAINDEKGKIVSFISTQHDITKRKKAEEEIKRMNELFQDTENVGNVGSWNWVIGTNVVHWSDNLCQIHGLQPEEFDGTFDMAKSFYHPDDKDRIQKITQQLLDEKKPLQLEYRIISKGGIEKHLLGNQKIITSEKGDIIRMMGMLKDITDRKKVEERLTESKERYRNLVETMRESLVISDQNFRFTYVNDRFCDMLSYSRDELIGQPVIDFVYDDYRKVLKDQMNKRKVGKEERYEVAWRTKDGNKILTVASPKAFFDDEKSFKGSFSILTDITDRKKAEEELRLHSILLTNMDEGVYMIRASDGIIIYTNPAFERMFGYDPGEMIGKHVSIVNAPTQKDPEDRAKEIIEFLNKTGKWEGEVNNIKKDGTSLWCYAIVSTFEHHEYGPVWISVHTDITDLFEAQEALRESEAFNFALFEHNPIETIVVDRERKIVQFNLAKKKSGDRLPKIGDIMYKDYAGKHEIDMYVELTECFRSGETKEFPEQKYGDRIVSLFNLSDTSAKKLRCTFNIYSRG